MTVHLIHGFNVSDGGRGTVGRLQPYIAGAEVSHDYGWTGLITLRCRNRKAVRTILNKIEPGDILVAHSNGALICHELAEILGPALGGVVVINPALRRDTVWAKGVPVLCLSNSTDWVVQLGRVWGRLVSVGTFSTHGWGAAGRYGFTRPNPLIMNWDTADGHWTNPVKGHSGVFAHPDVAYWGLKIGAWIGAQQARRRADREVGARKRVGLQ